MPRWIFAFVLAFSTTVAAGADFYYKRVEYKCNGDSCVGLFYSDRTATARRPAVLLADEAGSTRTATKEHAAELAKLGYIVFTVDLYGDQDGMHDRKKGRPASVIDEIKNPDHKLIRERASAAYEALVRQSGVNTKQVAAVGFGIGGTAMIELARTGVDLEGVVDVHGPVTSARPDDKEQVQPTFLILAGEDDPEEPEPQLKAFNEEMAKAKVECTVTRYRGVGHDFNDETEAKAEAAIKDYLAAEIPLKAATAARIETKRASSASEGIPDNVIKVLAYIDEHGEPMEGYEGGRTFGNYEHHLATTDRTGRRVKYREWDVNPHRPGVNRGTDRLITGSDETAWYTDDHYQTFKKVR